MAKYDSWLTEEGLIKVEGWARDGLTDKQISQNMGVAYSTLRVWLKKFPALSAQLRKGKEVVDRQVENALFKSAIGYEYEERTYETVTLYRTETQEVGDEVIVTKIPETKEILTKRVTKQVAPNALSGKFWLTNRKPKEWRDKKETELSGSVDLGTQAKRIEDFLKDFDANE